MADDRPRARDGRGKYTRDPHTAQRDAQACELRAQGRSYRQIATELGFADKGEAWRAVQRGLDHIIREPAEQLRAVEASRLDELYVEALEVLARDHLTVSNGRVMKHDDGTPILDDGPKLHAIDRLLKVRESYRKLFGIDAPSRVTVDAENLGREILDMLGAGGPDDVGGADDDSA